MAEHYRFVAKHLKAPARQVYPVRAKVWLYSGGGAWYFATIPVKTSKEIKKRHGLSVRGWGSLRVSVKLGESEWSTSIFPYSKTKGYILPLKAQIRKREQVRRGDTVLFHLSIG